MASSFITIEELSGALRLVTLRGAALPKQNSANWGGKQRVVTTWYPGNGAEATQQILGPTEAQTMWEGEWNTNRLAGIDSVSLSDATRPGVLSIFSANDVATVLEDILRSGSLLRVIWAYDPERVVGPNLPGAGQSLAGTYVPVEIIREGRATDWDFKYATGDDIIWSITWDWRSRGKNQQQVVQLRDGSSSTKNALTAMSLITEAAAVTPEDNTVYSVTRSVPQGASKFTLGQLQALANQVRQQVRFFSQAMNRIAGHIATVTEIINTVKNLPFEIANQALDLSTNMIAESNRFYDAVSQKPTELYDTEQKYTTFLRAMNFAKGATDISQEVAATGADSQSVFAAQLQQQRASGEQGNAQPLGVKPGRQVGGSNTQAQAHVVRRGDTLISLSMQFYGTPDGAADIAFANALSIRTPTLPIGRVLIIPPPRNLSGNIIGVARPALQPSSPFNPTQPNGVGSSPNTP
jgi:hypothetical protein